MYLIEALGNIARKLNVLLLIYAHRNDVGLIKKDISCHKCGISEQSGVDIIGMACALVLELSHSSELAEHCETIENPRKLCVCGNVRLNIQSVFVGIKPAGNIQCKRFICAPAQIGRNLSDRYCVHINNTVKALIFFGIIREVADCPEIITYCKIARWLNSRKGNRCAVYHFENPFSLKSILLHSK